MKQFIYRLLAVLLALLLLFPMPVYAEDNDGITDIPELHGNGNMRYRDNYAIDVEELGMMDVVAKGAEFLVNFILDLDCSIVEISAVLFYYCATLSLTDLLQGQFDSIQRGLYDQIFMIFVPIGVVAVGMFCAKALLKRNGGAIYMQLLMFCSVLLGAAMLTTQTNAVVSMIDDITMGISQQLVNVVYGGGDEQKPDSYAVTVAGMMWDGMIHQPWVAMNLEGDEEDRAEELLNMAPNSSKRKDYISRITDREGNTLFSKDKLGEQLVQLIINTVAILAKCTIYCAFGGLQLAFRIFTVVLALMGIFILLLAMIPQLGGTRLVGVWLRKVLGIQLNIIVLSLLLSFTLVIDKWIAALTIGWVLVPILQVALCAVIFFERKQILSITKFVNQSVSNPGMLPMRRAIENSDNFIYNAPATVKKAAQLTGTAFNGVTKSAADGWRNIEDGAERGVRKASASEYRSSVERRQDASKRQHVYYYNTPAQERSTPDTATAAYHRPMPATRPMLQPAANRTALVFTDSTPAINPQTYTQEQITSPVNITTEPTQAVPQSATKRSKTTPEAPRPHPTAASTRVQSAVSTQSINITDSGTAAKGQQTQRKRPTVTVPIQAASSTATVPITAHADAPQPVHAAKSDTAATEQQTQYRRPAATIPMQAVPTAATVPTTAAHAAAPRRSAAPRVAVQNDTAAKRTRPTVAKHTNSVVTAAPPLEASVRTAANPQQAEKAAMPQAVHNSGSHRSTDTDADSRKQPSTTQNAPTRQGQDETAMNTKKSKKGVTEAANPVSVATAIKLPSAATKKQPMRTDEAPPSRPTLTPAKVMKK